MAVKQRLTPERLIQRAICDYLALRPREIFFWVQDTKGTFDPRTGRYLPKASVPYARTGVADIQVKYLVAGIPVDVQFEVKTPSNDVNTNQLVFSSEFGQWGGFYFVVRSIDDAISALASVRAKVVDRIKAAQV